MLGWLAIVVGLGGLVLLGCKATRSGYESAPYRVVRADGAFEIREYPVLTIVETPMNTVDRGADGSFNRLFRYITGQNEGGQKIAMTTPVFMSESATNATMAFVLPAKLAAGKSPRPLDTSVQLRELPAGRFAVVRFRGGRNAENEAEAIKKLETWMGAERLKSSPPAIFAYFDPPWTPGFLRRNEVMMRMAMAD
jgi:DNA gyrase inhibitor GyrI